MASIDLHPEWMELLQKHASEKTFNHLFAFVESVYQSAVVYPPRQMLFSAFDLCLPSQVKVVLLGQDPYHQMGQANGLSFSVNNGVRVPPSLKNIFKELEQDIPGFVSPPSGNLESWARQGVLLLNTVLTVEDSKPGSHRHSGWLAFTDSVIQALGKEKENCVFMLWGNYAISKATLIDATRHLVLKAAHPSPLARGAFFGCKHFSKANAYLLEHGREAVNWRLT